MADDDTPESTKMRTPLGVAGLMLVVGIAGTYALSSDESDSTTGSEPSATIINDVVDVVTDKLPDVDVPIPNTDTNGDSDAATGDATSDGSPSSGPSETGQKDATRNQEELLAGLPSVPSFKPARARAVVTPQVRNAMGGGVKAVFIVRITDDPDIEACVKLHAKDPTQAKKYWQAYQARTPAFKDFSYEGGSYSGEVKLGYQFAAGVQPTRADTAKVIEKITAVKGVKYAEQDFIAHPGQGE